MNSIYPACASLLLQLFTTLVLPSGNTQANELPSVFNGKDFAGWKVPVENNWWKAENGILSVRSGPSRKGSTLWTEKRYTNFVMEFEFRFGQGTVDSGIFVRNSHEQIQIGISGSLKRDMTASPYIVGKGYPVEAAGVKELLKQGHWNSMTIVAIGKNYSVWLNGVHVLSYDSVTAVEQGPVGIQLHANKDMSIDYRKITLAELN